MRLRSLWLMAAMTAALQSASAQDAARSVHGSVITSSHAPKLQIRLPESARYLGKDAWVLFGMSNCELHAFVDADANKRVKRLYWIQFESYLPSRPELKHTYDSPRRAQLGGLDFYLDTWVDSANDEAGSDSEHIKALIRARGYRLPEHMISMRLVHLLDEKKRDELMIIYSEDAAPLGVSADSLRPGGSAQGQWAAVEAGLVRRGEQRIEVQR